MKCRVPITEDERTKCRRVTEAFEEFYEETDVYVIETEPYGFIMLRYFYPEGFETAVSFDNAEDLFAHLWDEWFFVKLTELAYKKSMEDLSPDEVYESLSMEEKQMFKDKFRYFSEKSGVTGFDPEL